MCASNSLTSGSGSKNKEATPMHFDGAGDTPVAPENNLTHMREHGSAAWEAYVAAEEKARAIAGGGVNYARLAVLSADKAKADATPKA
jgi:hypothetical protein